ARDALGALVASVTTVKLYAVSGDKYFGRVLADARRDDGSDLATILLERDLVRPYHGGRRSSVFCSRAG
ncbi:MAG: thermonuclease family protein, partial [Pararhizobium sp.]